MQASTPTAQKISEPVLEYLSHKALTDLQGNFDKLKCLSKIANVCDIVHDPFCALSNVSGRFLASQIWMIVDIMCSILQNKYSPNRKHI